MVARDAKRLQDVESLGSVVEASGRTKKPRGGLSYRRTTLHVPVCVIGSVDERPAVP